MPTDAPLRELGAMQPHAWADGWYQFARRVPSPNFGPRPADVAIDLVVIHAISLPPGHYQGDAIEQLFTNQLDCQAHPYYRSLQGLRVSAHFVIRRTGELLQFVSCDARAWHAGESTHQGRKGCNDFSIGIEMEGLSGHAFESAQYETLTSLCAAIMQRYPISAYAGHEHIAPGRKDDPGAGFEWPLLARRLALGSEYLPADCVS